MAKIVRSRHESLHPRSRHAGISPNDLKLRIRHPEFPVDDPALERQVVTLFDELAGSPEENLLSLDRPCAPTADMACYPLDLFDRTVTAGTYSPGDQWSEPTQWDAKYVEGDTDFSLTQDTAPYSAEVISSLGASNWSHTSPSKPAGACTGIKFTFGTLFEESHWYKFTVPAHPADAAGIVFGPVTFYAPTGLAGGTVGQNEGAVLLTSLIEPTSVRGGTVVGLLPHNVSTSVFIPISQVPAEGADLWIGVAPNWQAEIGTYTCGFRWPWMDGQGTSAKAYLTSVDTTPAWQTWDVTGSAWGSALDSDETGAWWDGNLPWSVATSGGGSYGVDGSSIFLTVPAGSQETLVATMAGTSDYSVDEDVDAAYGDPWSSELGVRMKARFRLTTAGSRTEAGSRYLRFRWHDRQEVKEVTVWLGDVAHAQGLTIAADSVSSTLAKDITEGSWMWVTLDTRNPYRLRGKLWTEQDALGSGEPAVFDVSITTSDDTTVSSSGDYFEMAMSVGNETGADQTLEVSGIWFCGGAEDCDWVEERIGEGDGSTARYNTSLPFKKNGLWFFIDGHHVRTVAFDYTGGEFGGVDTLPAASEAILVARYLVDGNPDGD